VAWPGQAFEHEPDHGEPNEDSDGCRVAFEVARETAIAADPGECPLDDPSLRQDDETMKIAQRFDNLDLPACPAATTVVAIFDPPVSGIGKYSLHERKAPPPIAQQIAHAVMILNIWRAKRSRRAGD
jgi:hypothetical protein